VGSILCCIQSGDFPKENLAIFRLQHQYENKKLKNILLCFFGYPNCTMYMKSGKFSLNFGPILTIENLKRHLILIFLVFKKKITFSGHMWPAEKWLGGGGERKTRQKKKKKK